MSYYLGNDARLNGNAGQPIVTNDGIQEVSPIVTEPQIVYLDFDGAETPYNNEELDLNIDVKVEDSGLSIERIEEITAQLNRSYADQNICFTVTKPVETEYSTVYIGNTDAFADYGEFYGLAETVDSGNKIKNDDAFVILDNTYSNAEIISVIEHETAHIVRGEAHGKTEGLSNYTLQKLVDTRSATCYVEVYRYGGYNPGNVHTISDSWYSDMPSNADKIVITITNENEKYGNSGTAAWRETIYATINGSKYAIQLDDCLTLTVYSAVNIQLDREAYLKLSTAFAENIYDPLTGFIVGYRYYYNDGYDKNKITITAKYYQNIPIADLEITAAGFSRNTPDTVRFDPAEKYSYTFTVKNKGDLAAETSKAYLYVDGKKHTEISIKELAAGASETYTYNFAAGEIKEGTHTIYVTADASKIINEDSETNNSSPSVSFIVEPAKADLAVENLSIDNNDSEGIDVTKAVSVSATIQNRSGNKKSSATTAKLYAGNTLLKSFTIPAIEAGEIFELSCIIPAQSLSAGKTAFKLVLDNENKCDEFNEKNNEYSVTKMLLSRDVPINLYQGGSLVSQYNSLSNQSIEGYTSVFVDKGGLLTNLTALKEGTIFIRNGGSANSITLNSGGNLYISRGGKVNSTIVNSNGQLRVSSGGVANSTTVNYMGSLCISSGGTANDTTINSGGDMYVSSGGTATNVHWTPCVGDVYAEAGAYITYASSYSGVYYGAYNELLSHTETMNNKILSGNVECFVMSNGIANDTVLSGFATHLDIGSGGSANNTFVKSGTMTISSGGTANDTTISSGGDMFVSSGGTANDTTISSGGYMFVSSGGTATNVHWTPCEGDVYAEAGAYITYASSHSGVYYGSGNKLLSRTEKIMVDERLYRGSSAYVMNNGSAYNTIISSGGSIFICTGGVANFTTVKSSGGLTISSGGTATAIKENGGYVVVREGAYVTFAANTLSRLVLSNGSATVHSGTVANSTTVNDWGYLDIYSGGVANSTTVNSRGYLRVSSGGTANSTTVNSNGYLRVSSGGTANSTTVNCGNLEIYSGGVANSTTVDSYGHLYIYSGGVANSTTVDSYGYLYIYSGGVANDTTLNSYGGIVVNSEGVHKGSLQFGSGAYVSAYTGSIIDFTVYDRSVSDDYLINNLALIKGVPTYTITVSANQEDGMYKLAQGAENFAGSITVTTDTGTDLGTLSVGGKLTANGDTYALSKENGALHFYVNPIVSSGGTSSGGIVSSAVSSKVVLCSGGVCTPLGSSVSGKTINSGVSLNVYSGGVTKNTTVNRGGNVILSSGGAANVTTINSQGGLHVYSGATASNTTVKQSGYLGVGLGATTYNTTIDYAGELTVWGGGKVYNNTINQWGAIILSSGAVADSSVINSQGGLHVYSGAVASNTTVKQKGIFGVGLGATTYNTLIDYAGELKVWGGGKVYNNTINQYGAIILLSGAMADTTTINSQGGLHVYSGAVASNTTVKQGGFFGVGDGATTYNTLIDYAGELTVWGGGLVNDNEINQWGAIILSSGAAANRTIINPDGGLHIYNGATAYTTEVTSGAKLGIGSGGYLYGSELDNTGTMTFYEGAKMGGWNSFEGSVITSGGVDASGAYVNFELDDRTSDQGVILDNIGNFYSVQRYSMEVDADQVGTFQLAAGASAFNDRITLYVEDGVDCGSLAVGESLDYNGRKYTLSNDAGILALKIS